MEILLFAILAYIFYTTRTLNWATASVVICTVFSMSSLALAFNSTQAKQDLYTRGMTLLGGNIPEKIKEQFTKDIGLSKKGVLPLIYGEDSDVKQPLTPQ